MLLKTVIPPRLRPGTTSSTVPSIIEVDMRLRPPCCSCDGATSVAGFAPGLEAERVGAIVRAGLQSGGRWLGGSSTSSDSPRSRELWPTVTV